MRENIFAAGRFSRILKESIILDREMIFLRFWADLHIHSKYSIATSKDCEPENLAYWAKRKGLTLIGTGDLTHPAWRQTLKDRLEPAEDGLWQLKEEYQRSFLNSVGESVWDASLSLGPKVRFVLSGEISTIYKKNGRTRKVHHLILLPGFAEADLLADRLDKIGNIRADGRPILGLDSRNLLEMVLETSSRAIYIPAHIWTPHFSVFGANSGFDSLEECYEDLTGEIMALETGLSSDPAMNWRWSALDAFPLLSNSDAHSPRNLAREANLFDMELSYDNLRFALQEPKGKFLGTVEFFPEEGKYHWDGHRACGVQWEPEQTRKAGGICPVCGKKVTVGVLHRTEVLADRSPGQRSDVARPYERLVSLPKVIASAMGVGEKSKKVEKIYDKLLAKCGPELMVLREIPLKEVESVAGILTAEGIRRTRHGLLEIKPGFDGQYGEVNVFRDDERRSFSGQATLFVDTPTLILPSMGLTEAGTSQINVDRLNISDEQAASIEAPAHSGERDQVPPASVGLAGFYELNPEQQKAVLSKAKRVVVLAGPGTGKTRTLLHRVEFLLTEGVPANRITCLTFTKKAAEDLGRRLAGLLSPVAGGRARRVHVGNLHQLCLKLINCCPQAKRRPLLSEYEATGFLSQVKGVSLREMALAISKLKNKDLRPGDPGVPEEWRELYHSYQEKLAAYQVLDFDELLVYTIELLEKGLVPQGVLDGYDHLLVDEFQDLTPLQYRLVKLLSGESLFVIGDPDQAIYGFRGAEHRVFQEFLQDFPEHQVYTLTRNYRSASYILKAANSVIKYNTRFQPMENEAVAETETGRIRVVKTESEKAEASAVVREVVSLVGGTDLLSAHGEHRSKEYPGESRSGASPNYSFGEIAVLYRTGRQLDALEEAFAKAGLPYKVVGEKKLLYSKEIRETITFFHALLEPEDYLLLSALHLDPFNPGAEYLEKLWAIYRDHRYGEGGSAPQEAAGEKQQANHTSHAEVSGEHYLNLDFLRFLQTFFTESDLNIKGGTEVSSRQLEAVADCLMDSGDMYNLKKNERGRSGAPFIPESLAWVDTDLCEKIQCFLRLYKKYTARLDHSPSAVLTEWITDCQWDEQKKEVQELLGLAALSADLRELFTRLQVGREGDLERLGQKGPAPEYINLMTLHAAKGLEYPAVLITGVEEGLLPLQNNKGETEIEEERRLFYVGLTRAKRELILFQAKRRRRFGASEDHAASRFLGEIPSELLFYEESATMRRRKHHQKGLF